MTAQYQEGDRIAWEYGTGSFTGNARGEVVEAGLEKFGHDDVIAVRSDSRPNETTHIRPKDIVKEL